MAELIGITSGIITLVSLTLKASGVLYSTITSFQTKEKKVRELRDEVKGLNEVLTTLENSIADIAVDLEAFKKVLQRCCNSCKEFNSLAAKYAGNSTEQRTRLKDWYKLRYMGEDITGFKNTLAGYKATLTIALVYANMRTTRSTKDLLDEYKDLIENTKYDLEVHLQEIVTRLESTATQSQTIPEIDTGELRRLGEERDSTQQCLKICSQAYDQLEQAHQTSLRAMEPPPNLINQASSLTDVSLPWLILAEGFNSGQTGFISSKLRLQQLLYGINSQLQTTQYRLPLPQAEQIGPKRDLEEEAHVTKEALSLCDKAANQESEIRRNFYEGVALGNDSQQIIVSIKDLISAKNVKAGDRSLQVMGQINATNLQHLAQGHHHSAGKDGNTRADEKGNHSAAKEDE